jgi:hypothetical protein
MIISGEATAYKRSVDPPVTVILGVLIVAPLLPEPALLLSKAATPPVTVKSSAQISEPPFELSTVPVAKVAVTEELAFAGALNS